MLSKCTGSSLSSKKNLHIGWHILSRQQAFVLLVLLLVNKPASRLSNKSLLTIFSSQDAQQEPTGCSLSVKILRFGDQTVQCEHINGEL